MMDARMDNNCMHCGADCGRKPVLWEDKKFCCNGCRTVYQILNDKKLYSYYELEKNPGIKIEDSEHGEKYSFLDKPEIREKFISFSDGRVSKVSFYIPVIHCISCVWLLEHLDMLSPHIKYSFVNFAKKEIDITFDEGKISLRQVVELLASVHYIPDLSYSISDKEDTRKSNRKLLFKIGVAGFVFVNVMTYSLPAYFNRAPLGEELQNLFSILSFLLVIPVVFFSGNDYYIATYKSLKNRKISLDLPIALGILVLFLVSFYEIILSDGVGYCDSLSGLIFFLLVGKWYQGKTYEALSFDRNYKSYFPIAVTRINEQVEESILLENIEVKDELLIRNKELIPADSILLEGDALIDYSFVTGESTPVLKSIGDFIYAGGRQVGGIIKIKVEKDINQSHLTKLWNQDKSYSKPGDNLEKLSDKIGRYFTIVIIGIALIGLIYWLINSGLREAMFVFTAVLIVACPCALALSIPFTFGNTMRIFGKNGFYIKNTAVIEKLSRINTIVFDKTGTLTRPDKNRIDYKGDVLSTDQVNAVYSIVKQSQHPLSVSLASYYSGAEYLHPEHFTEVPGRGIYGRSNGMDIKIGSREYIFRQGGVEEANSSKVFLSVNDEVKGEYNISNLYREGIEPVLTGLSKDFSLYLLSGDNNSEYDKLRKYFPAANLRFNQKPNDKADFIKSLQEDNNYILMTGDGLNDAGALLQSDVALTIANKAHNFSPASDAILEADQFPSLAKYIGFVKTSIRIVKLSFLISFLYNIIGLSFAVTGNLSPIVAAILMPISSVSVVAFATFATRLMGRRIGGSTNTSPS